MCVIGNHAATVASASPFATDSKTTATSTGVTVTLNPFCSITSFITPEEARSESHGVDTSSISTPSTSSTPSVHVATFSSFSATQRLATSSTSSPVSTDSYMIASISSTSQLNWSINLNASGCSSPNPILTKELIPSPPPFISLDHLNISNLDILQTSNEDSSL